MCRREDFWWSALKGEGSNEEFTMNSVITWTRLNVGGLSRLILFCNILNMLKSSC